MQTQANAAENLAIDPKLLLKTPDLWASIMFGHEVPDFHSWLWRYLVSDIQYLVVLLPGGHGKSQIVSMEFPIWLLCHDPNHRTALIHKGIEQAKRQMEAMQRQLVHNPLLTELYGPFKAAGKGEDTGYPWSTTTLRVAKNTDTKEKTNSVHAFGVSSTDVLGYRFKTIIPDDVCTDQNSNTPEARAKLETKLSTEWDKTLIGCDRPRLRMVGTAFAFDDLYLSKSDRNVCTAFLGPNDWREPDQIDSSGYVVILKDAEAGMRSSPLWPKQMPWSRLKVEKSLNITNYNRRLRNIVQDPNTAIFSEEAIRGQGGFKGCLDHDRAIGERPSNLRVVCGADPSSGKKTGAAAQFAHVTVGVEPSQPDTVYLLDLFTAPIPAGPKREDYSSPKDGESQIGTIIYRHRKYTAAYTVIEDNSQQYAWIQNTKECAPDCKVVSHHTGRKKVDPEVGVESMAGLIESGRLRFPYKGEATQRLVDQLIEQLVRYPHYSYSDLVMALWFCCFRIKKKAGIRVMSKDGFRNRNRAA